MQKGVIIVGSSRSKGNTYQLAKFLQEQTQYDIIDLSTITIEHFNYELEYKDEFNQLFKSLVDTYDTIVFATPVYWYSMSGKLKVFFDRISDFLYGEKEYGRKLRGKTTAMISCSGEQDIEATFYIPFKKSVDYLGMSTIGVIHGCLAEDVVTEKTKQRLTELAIALKQETVINN